MPEPGDVLTEPDDVTGLRPQGADDGVLVEVRDLSVHYLGRQEWILRHVSFDQLVGKVTAVIGPSGCGKTTLVRALCGLVPHCLASEYSGSLQLAGTEIADASVQLISGHIAYVGQNPDAAVVTRTVHDDVAFPLQNLCLPRDEISSRVVDALNSVGLLDRIWDDPWTLSGGQRQRLAVAVALAMRPRLLVLDEPTSTIDPAGQRDFYTLVAGLVAGGMGVVVIDHDLDPVLPIVDQVLALDADGRTIACGPPGEVFGQHRDELAGAGMWLPRDLRAGTASGPAPQLTDFCAPGEVRSFERSPEGWREIPVIDTTDDRAADETPHVDVAGLGVPGRSPEVTMRLGGGEFVALIGPNGAGKSSLLSALAGLVGSTATHATVCGQPVRHGQHPVGYVFQNPEHQFVASTVEAELSVGGTPAARVDDLLEQFHLTGHRSHHPLTLSGGQGRRLTVATMVSEERDVVVLDEPTYGQDWDNTRELMAFIDELRAQGRTVIMATHHLELALDHCTHLLALPLRDETGEPAVPVEAGIPERPCRRRGLFTGMNPLTMFLALIPAMVGIFVLRNLALNLTIMALASVLIAAARATLRRTIGSVVGIWAIAALMVWAFLGLKGAAVEARFFERGDALTAGTGIAALIALVLLSGISADPDSLMRTLTGTFRLPYRVGSAGIAAIAFVTRFRQDFVILRTARALRGIGRRWGVLAPVVRWLSSVVPLMILAIQHAERVALSMDSRAFGAHPRRTELLDVPWRMRDAVVVVAVWSVTAGLWWWLG
ncbi:MAG: ATP-binding cassette domain-containing protein [Arachnia propionica]